MRLIDNCFAESHAPRVGGGGGGGVGERARALPHKRWARHRNGSV